MYRYTQWTGWKKNNSTAMIVCIKDKEKLEKNTTSKTKPKTLIFNDSKNTSFQKTHPHTYYTNN